MSALVEYEFRLPTGELVTQLCDCNYAPKLYEQHTLDDGRVAIRVPSIGQRPRIDDPSHTDFVHHRDLHWDDPERCLKGADGKRAYPRVNEKGQPIWANRKEIKEACARMNWTYDDCETHSREL